MLTNSQLVHELSTTLAASLWQSLTPEEQSQPQAFIVAAYETILSRRPTDAEMKLCIEFLSPAADPPSNEIVNRRRQGLVRALFNHNDFIVVR